MIPNQLLILQIKYFLFQYFFNNFFLLNVIKVAKLFVETELTEDQARMVIGGAAYYDVEATDGSWIRILCEYGDLM